MAKLDGLKEEINTFRIILTIISLVIIALTSGLINRIDNNKIDYYLYVGLIIDIVLIIIIPFILKLISKITKEVKYTKE